MKRLEINGTGNDHLTENEKRQLEDGLRILARIITKAILGEKSLLDRSPCKEYRDSAVQPYQVTTAGKPNEPVALSVKAAAKILGLSRASVYEAVRTGQIPSIRFGKRIVVPRAALNKMLSQTGTYKSEHR
jgi:excisionase family DNA binding protein